MFQTIKEKVSLLEVISKDMKVPFKQSGENYVVEDEAEYGGCPFCGHKDCFKVKEVEGTSEDHHSFFKCFSCDEHGDVIEWRAKRLGISQKEAVLGLAKEFSIELPKLVHSPVQEVFNLAAKYYENLLWETAKGPGYIDLNRLNPLEYQLQVRKHSEAILKSMHVGWSDGGLVEYLEGVGTDDEAIELSGLRNKKTGRDFLPAKCFVFPHYVKGKVSHFTFKDPNKKIAYQLPKKNSLNGYIFYNQDSVKNSETVVVVEGEHDCISLLDTNKTPAVIATIGQISSEQLEWMREHLSTKNVLTIFDPDGAGDKYRIKVEKNRKYFKNLAHVLPPEDKDIDDLLKEGRDLEKLISENIVKVNPNSVEVSPEEKKQPVIEVPWNQSTPEGFKNTLAENGLGSPGESKGEDIRKEEDPTSGNIVQRKGGYSRVKFEDGVPEWVPISDFIIKLVNVFNTEDGKTREIQIIKDNGYKSKLTLVSDDTKVSLKPFRVMAARAADATFTGNEWDLSNVWKIVYAQVPSSEI